MLVSGVVVSEDDKVLRVVSNPLEKAKNAREVIKEEIVERLESKVSLMPLGLLNTLTKEEIFDLLAYIRSAGDPKHAAFDR